MAVSSFRVFLKAEASGSRRDSPFRERSLETCLLSGNVASASCANPLSARSGARAERESKFPGGVNGRPREISQRAPATAGEIEPASDVNHQARHCCEPKSFKCEAGNAGV